MATKEQLSIPEQQKILIENWDVISERIQHDHVEVAPIEMAQVKGSRERLAQLLEAKTGQNRAQVEEYLDECCQHATSFSAKTAEMASSAADTLRENARQAADQAARGYEYSRDAVARYPMQTVATAFGLGALAGLMIGISMGVQRERQQHWWNRR